MTVFGDATPEDAWDPDDAVSDLVENLRRRLALLLGLSILTDRDRQRLDLIHGDFAHVIKRILEDKLGSQHG
jgi:hypothetical protein